MGNGETIYRKSVFRTQFCLNNYISIPNIDDHKFGFVVPVHATNK